MPVLWLVAVVTAMSPPLNCVAPAEAAGAAVPIVGGKASDRALLKSAVERLGGTLIERIEVVTVEPFELLSVDDVVPAPRGDE